MSNPVPDIHQLYDGLKDAHVTLKGRYHDALNRLCELEAQIKDMRSFDLDDKDSLILRMQSILKARGLMDKVVLKGNYVSFEKHQDLKERYAMLYARFNQTEVSQEELTLPNF